MKRTTVLAWAISLLIIATLACGSATPDTQATVDAAVAATNTAQAGVQATIDAAVQATGAAALTPTPAPDTQATADAAAAAPTSTPVPDTQATADAAAAAPTPTPPADYVNMTEEELVALIDQAVAQAVTAAEQCSTATTSATADDTITQEEVQSVTVYVTGAEEAIAYAEELISVYYSLYGDLAAETLAILQQVEQDLAALAETTAAINTALQEANTALEQGLALAEETITQLETAAQTASAKAAEAQARAKDWATKLQAERENRAATALTVQPNQIAADRQGALQSAFDYVDTVRQALADNKISQAELANIAQLGANASASLEAHGGPQLQHLSGSINEITEQTARGRLPQAKTGLGNFEASLGSRPEKPDVPDRPEPAKPSKPSRP